MPEERAPDPSDGRAPKNGDHAAPKPPDPAAPGTCTVLWIAAWFGACSGLAEALVSGVCSIVDPTLIPLNPHCFWSLPAADALYFAVFGLVVAAAARSVPRFVGFRAMFFVFATLAFASVIFHFCPPISHWPAIALASGLGFQSSKILVARREGFVRVVRRSTAWISATVAIIACAVFAAPHVREARAEARPSVRAASGAPNVLLVVMDTVRAASVSHEGYERDTTPNLTRLARTGVRFERAVTPAPWTLPTHATLFTGRESHVFHTGRELPIDSTYPTLAEILHSHGYATAGFVGNVVYCNARTGLARGFAHYEDFRVRVDELIEGPALFALVMIRLRDALGRFDPPGRIRAPDINAEFLDWLAGKDERPYFAFVNYFDAHDPYAPPPPYDTMFGQPMPKSANPPRFDARFNDLSEIAALKAQYEGGIAYVDHHVGALLDELRARGALDNTLVIVLSDHGEEFFEHGVFGHSASLYMPSLHVPLVISMPGKVPAGRSVAEAVAIRDVGSTILGLAGLTEEASKFPGSSLAAHWNGAAAPPARPILSSVETNRFRPAWWPGGPGNLSAVLLDGYHYIRRDSDGHEELYDWSADPRESKDLAASAADAAILSRCRETLDRLMSEAP